LTNGANEQYKDVALLGFGSDCTLNLIPAVLRPHLNALYFDRVSMDDMVRAVEEIDEPVYLIDDQTALKVIDDQIEVISEGAWKLVNEGNEDEKYCDY
jgi:dipeptidase E